MLVAVLSDVHDSVTRLLTALAYAREAGCTHLLFAGDMESSTTFRLMREEWPHGMDVVFGNNETERVTFAHLAQEWEATRLHGDVGTLKLAGRRLFLTHYPHVAAQAAATGEFDAAFFGHSHKAESVYVSTAQGGRCLLANPGEVCGLRYGHPTFGIYNTDDNTFSLHPL